MSPISTRKELFDKIDTHRRRLTKNIDHLSTEQLQRPGLVSNGWSAKDILAHLADWEQRFMDWLAIARRGENPKVPAPGFSWKPVDVDRLNQQIFESYRDKKLAAILEFFHAVHKEFVSSCETLSDEELFTPGYYDFTGEGRLFDWLDGYARHDAWGQKFTLKLMRENTPTKIKDRAEIIKRLQADRRRLENNIAALSLSDLAQTDTIGPWALKDLLLHLAEWESFFPTWVEASRRGETVETPVPGLTWGQLNVLNERIYQKHREKTASEALTFFRSVHDEFMALVETMTEEEVLTPGFYAFTGKGSIFDWLAAYAAHDRWGKTEIRQWLKRGGTLT